MPIDKDGLIGKTVLYMDHDGKTRSDRVVAIDGNTLTVKNGLGERRRIRESEPGRSLSSPITIRIYGVITPKHSHTDQAVPILWHNLKVKE